MEGKNIPPFITLSAAMIACVICILRGATLYTTLKIVLLVMVVFYIIGRIVQAILVKINKDAEEAALERQRIQQELAAKELAEAELEKQAEQETAAGEGASSEETEFPKEENNAV
ncbi:MAG: hypothetical protein IKT67_02030 [Lachnospiraceae bacterium]|nr:hypothetical protein [Lachnospiraceae bacterium]